MGISQEAFGVLAGVAKKTQGLYESGERSPDVEYLEKLRAAGCDVIYVLEGRREDAARSKTGEQSVGPPVMDDQARGAYRVEPEVPAVPPPVMSVQSPDWRIVLAEIVNALHARQRVFDGEELARIVDGMVVSLKLNGISEREEIRREIAKLFL